MAIDLVIACLVGALLVLTPLPLHWKTGNVCVVSAIVWLTTWNTVIGVSAFIWRDNAIVRFEVWCDIAVRILVGGNIGVPVSAMCIARRLAHASSPHRRALNLNNKRRHSRVEIGMCVVLPIMFAALNVMVEAKRFSLEEGVGCSIYLEYSIPALFIFYFPPVVISLATTAYSGIALRWLIHRRALSHRASQYTQPPAPSGRYLRFVGFTTASMTFATTMSLISMVQAFQLKLDPWSWAGVHEDWLTIPVFLHGSRSEFYWALRKMGGYFAPITSLVFFGCFGFDYRLITEYKNTLTWIKTHALHIKPNQDSVLPLSADNAVTAPSLQLVVNTNMTHDAPEAELVTSGVNQQNAVPDSHPIISIVLG